MISGFYRSASHGPGAFIDTRKVFLGISRLVIDPCLQQGGPAGDGVTVAVIPCVEIKPIAGAGQHAVMTVIDADPAFRCTCPLPYCHWNARIPHFLVRRSPD
jgi:hypothetical protein